MSFHGSELTYFSEYESAGMGSWLSSIWHGISNTKSSGDKAAEAARASIVGSMTLLLSQQLMASCKTALPADISASLTSVINQFNAWTTIQTSSDIVSAVMTATISDLNTKGKLTAIPGCGTAAVPIANQQTAATGLTLSTPILLMGGAGLIAFMLLAKHKR